MKSKPLTEAYFAADTVTVARDLLGKRLVRDLPDGTRLSHVITETEAYDGFEDQASHAHRGQTPRNAVMFGPPGHLYLYLCYGIHWLLNITTREAGYPAAVLLRGVRGCAGPGRLTRLYHLNRAQNLLPLRPESGVWIENAPPPAPDLIHATPRIGIAYAGPEWQAKPWRFCLNEPV